MAKMGARRPGKATKTRRSPTKPRQPVIVRSSREERDAQGKLINRGKVVSLMSKPLPIEPQYKDIPVHGRKVILIPSARHEGLFHCVKSFVENAHAHNYKGPVDFVIADYSSHKYAHNNRVDFEALQKEINKAGMKNVQIHHMGLRRQRRVLNALYKSNPERWANLPSFVGDLNSTPNGYGPARNRVTVLAYQKGLLDNPKNVAILFDDDLVAKNLVRLDNRNFTGRNAGRYGRTAEGSLVLKDTGSYFHNIDQHFNQKPETLVSGGGITFDGDVAAQDVVGNTLTSIDAFLKGTRDVKKPRLKKMQGINVDVTHHDYRGAPIMTEQVPLSRAVFSRRFLGPWSVHAGFMNLMRKSRESMALGKSSLTPHYIPEKKGGVSTISTTLGAGNMYTRPHVLLSYPFIKSSERGEDRVFYEALGEDLPPGLINGTNNPVAHIKGGMRAKRTSALGNIVIEPGEVNRVPQWEPRIESIRNLLNARNAWWSRPQYSAEKQMIKNWITGIEGQIMPIIMRDSERQDKLAGSIRARQNAELRTQLDKLHNTTSEPTTLFDMMRENLMRKAPGAQTVVHDNERKSPLLPLYRDVIPEWRQMFPGKSTKIEKIQRKWMAERVTKNEEPEKALREGD